MILASAFLNQLRSDQFQIKPIYLLYGEEPLFLRDCLDGLRASLHSQDYLIGESYEVDNGFDWRGLQMETQAGSLFADKRVITVNMPKGAPGKEGGKFFQDWSQSTHHHVPPETVLMVMCGRLDARQVKAKWVNAIEAAGSVVQAKQVPINALPGWCQQHAQRYGLNLDVEAASLLAERVEGNLLAADQELIKLSLTLPANSRVSSQHIQEQVVDQAHYQLYTLMTSMLKGGVGQSVQMVHRLNQEGVEAGLVLWMLSKEIRLLIELTQLSQRVSLNQAFKQCRIWQSKQNEYSQAMGRHGLSDWQGMLRHALHIDMMIKGIRPTLNTGEVWFELAELVSKIARK